MLKVNRHINIEQELHDKVLLLSKQSKISYSEQISELLKEALSNRVKQEQLNRIENNLERIIKKICILYSLTEQIYSDFNINPNNITDPKNSIPLNCFLTKIKGSKFYD